MIEEILNMLTDSVAPKSVIMWFRRKISYKSRIDRSRSIPYEEFMNILVDMPKIKNEINENCAKHKATTLFLIACPIIDEMKYWLCTGIDDKAKFLFEMKFDVSRYNSFNLDENEMYNVVVNKK